VPKSGPVEVYQSPGHEGYLPPPTPQQPHDAKAAFDKFLSDLVAEKNAYWHALIRRFQPVLNAYLQAQAPETFDEKKALADQVSTCLGRLGLAIRHGQEPCTLMANRGETNRLGRFLLKPKGSGKALISRARLADLLPFELMEDAERREALTEWRDRVRRSQDTSPDHRK
jgi:hypothetical protein